MSYEMLVGLDVIDDKTYQAYRDAMTPILLSYGGSFGYDFKVSEVLKSDSANNINRVFIIRFANKNVMESFFSHSEYQKIKQQYFEKSVKNTTIISSYEKKE